MTERVINKFLKLFGELYLRFLSMAVFLMVLNAVLFTLVGASFPAGAKIIGFVFFLPVVLTVLQIGFDAYEGKIKDKL